MSFDSPDVPDRVVDHDTVFRAVADGNVLVTANTRLSRSITNRYSQWRMERGDRQWQSPNVYPYATWLARLWDRALVQRALPGRDPVPSERQLISLWERVVGDDPVSRRLVRPDAMAPLLRETRTLVRDWKLDLDDPAWRGDDDENSTAFARWNRAFERLCRSERWTPPEDRVQALLEALEKHDFLERTATDFLGFDEFTPGQRDLLEALSRNGVTVQRLSVAPTRGEAVTWQSRDGRHELRNMARWVRFWYEREPQSRIAVVVPDLPGRRREVERHLQEILVPDASRMHHRHPPWNISLGMPLMDEPMIRTAFNLFRLTDERLDIQHVARVLRSPWVRGGISERNSRALLEKCLRDHHPRLLTLGEIRYRASELENEDENPDPESRQPRPWNSPKFNLLLDQLDRFGRLRRKTLTPSDWAGRLDKLLNRLGWPLKGRGPGSEQDERNWQALQAWRDALRELASLDATSGSITFTSAVQKLARICRDTVFQPKSPPARIQVLGLYEINGLRFDHAWVLGLHHANWPPPARRNPFIPLRLQLDSKMPHSSPLRELEVARVVTRRLLDVAPDCVFSYPGQLDGEPTLASQLLVASGIPATDTVPGEGADDWKSGIHRSASAGWEPLEMPSRLESYAASGGSSILKHQALCPFRAFASNRLVAEGMESPADGISPKLHGSLVHQVLEHFWSEVRSRDRLVQMDDPELEACVRRHAETVVGNAIFLKQRPGFARVECDRLKRQAMACLELDRQREPFTVVDFEKEVHPVIEGQSIRLFIDRVDQTPDGETIIIDYKTGNVTPAKWFGDRPEDPQLPLYAISSERTPAAVAFFTIRDDGCEYSGVVSREGLLTGLPKSRGKVNARLLEAGQDMAGTIDEWRRVLHRLMAAFLAGEAAIDPKDGLKTCRDSYCKLQPLCRIDELDKRAHARDALQPPEAPA